MSPINMETGLPSFWKMMLLHSSSNRHACIVHWLRSGSSAADFIYKKELLSRSVCLAYARHLLLFGLLSHTFKKHHYSQFLILTVSEFLYILFHSCPIPLSLTSYLILSPFSPSFSSPYSRSPACPPQAFPV